MAPSAAAHETGLPPNVPPRPPGCTRVHDRRAPDHRRERESVGQRLRQAHEVRLEADRSQANIRPVRPKPVCTSSAMRRMPCSLHVLARSARNSRGGTMKPPSPITGSMMAHAIESGCTVLFRQAVKLGDGLPAHTPRPTCRAVCAAGPGSGSRYTSGANGPKPRRYGNGLAGERQGEQRATVKPGIERQHRGPAGGASVRS